MYTYYTELEKNSSADNYSRLHTETIMRRTNVANVVKQY